MRFGIGLAVFTAIAVLLGAASLLTPDYARPPIETEQIGYRGVGMVAVSNPRDDAAILAANAVVPPPLPLVTEGPKAGDVYQNVQVLGDISQAQFTRLMLAITQWVSPEQGCTYCHAAGEGFASDSLYTKRISRWMIQMTRNVNNEWTDHVQNAGVTCYTCHRGNNVPQYVWFEPEITGAEPGSNAMLGYYKSLYGPSEAAGLASLSQTPLGPYLDDDTQIRVVSDSALPSGNNASTKETEQTYALMMHMSQSLGVNCTYCHNTRAFTDWAQSPPARTTAWYGIRLARDLNNAYIEPVKDALPPYRLGPHAGDVPKVNCTTCHQGLAKPLNGVSMLQDYPSLAAANVTTTEELLPGTLEPMWQQAAAEPAATPTTQSTDAAPAADQPAPASDQAAQAGDQPASADTSASDTPSADEAARQSQDAAEDAGLSSPDPAAAATPEPPSENVAGEAAVPLERAPAEAAAEGGTQPAPTQNAAPPEGDASEATTTPGVPASDAEVIEEPGAGQTTGGTSAPR